MTKPLRESSSAGTILTVERGLRVLRAFRSDRAALSNAELVKRTGLSKAAVSRFTSTLLQIGLIRRVPEGRKFELSSGPLSIGHAYLATSDLVKRAHPVLQSYADAWDNAAVLGIRDGLDMVYVGYRVGNNVATLRLGAGSTLPIGVTALGHAYLWALPPDERDDLLNQILLSAGCQAGRVKKSIDDSFSQLDKTGACVVTSEYQRKVYGVGAPLFIGRDRTIMSLSFGNADYAGSFPTSRKRIVLAVKQAAAQLEAVLADYEGPP